ncbi:MAG TPA: lamin tail domain-containing protein, partial [Verrucomicrobiae bacterium]
LRNNTGAILLTVDYSDSNPWPVGADGTGHSLVLTRASYGQNDPRSWDASDRFLGSPGTHEPLRTRSGLRAVMINEILAHTDLPLADYVELYNYSTQAVNISGCFLSDAPLTNKFQIPPGTILAPHGYISFDETQLGFGLNHQGETIYFRSADAKQMLDAVQYEPQENGVATGRYPDGSPEFYRLSARTPGDTNAPPLVNDIVINEIMYGPISEDDDDEYVELYNKGAGPVNIGGWRFTKGIDFKFPPNTIIPADGYVVVAKNASHLLTHYGNLSTANTFGDFGGKFSRDGERVALAKPEIDVTTNGSGQLVTNTLYIIVEEVTYGTGGRWGQWANQGGSSLELIDPRSNHRLAYNWGDSDETAKAPWTRFEQSGLLDAGTTYMSQAIDRLEIIMLGEGECLLDDIEAGYGNGTTNLLANGNFEGGIAPWTPQGNHIASSLELTGRTGSRSLHVRSDGNGDTGANRIRSSITALTQNQIFTIRGYVRWLRGWPEITIRAKGGYLEAYGRMELPPNLGTPGARNSRALTNTAPAIYSVTHTPALPQTGDNVVVTAGVQDPDGVTNVVLFSRVDGTSPGSFGTQAMNDNGINGDAVAGDGIYSATIAAQTSGTMISFYVEAADALRATNQFPANAIVTAVDGQRRECLVRWGDPIPVSAFATYRIWMSRANVNTYINRPALSNQDVDGTMVVNNNRVVYNMFSHYSNSPYHQGQNGSPEAGGQHYDVHLPLDDKFLGSENFNKIHAPGNASFEDNNWLREQTAYWVARKVGMPYLSRRFVAMYINGIRKSGGNAGADALMEDTQRPGGELIGEFFPDETEGRLYKLQPWFEFDDVTVTTGSGSAGFENKLWCTLTPNLSTNAHKITRYRQNYLSRSADTTANDYTNVIALINAAALPTSHPAYWQNLSGLID